MELTATEYETLCAHKDTMKTIIINRAISEIPVAFREDVLQIAKNKHILNCNCSAGIFSAVSKLYNAMLDYETKQIENQTVTTKSKKQKK